MTSKEAKLQVKNLVAQRDVAGLEAIAQEIRKIADEMKENGKDGRAIYPLREAAFWAQCAANRLMGRTSMRVKGVDFE